MELGSDIGLQYSYQCIGPQSHWHDFLGFSMVQTGLELGASCIASRRWYAKTWLMTLWLYKVVDFTYKMRGGTNSCKKLSLSPWSMRWDPGKLWHQNLYTPYEVADTHTKLVEPKAGGSRAFSLSYLPERWTEMSQYQSSNSTTLYCKTWWSYATMQRMRLNLWTLILEDCCYTPTLHKLLTCRWSRESKEFKTQYLRANVTIGWRGNIHD
jgi:hypothetical protein